MNPLSVLTGTSSTRVAQAKPATPLSKPEGRELVLNIEKMIANLPQVEPPVTHGFAPGVYARKMFIAAGVGLAGRIHKYAHWTIVLKGKIVIIAENGTRKLITAPAMFVSPPGTKRTGFAIEDTEWVTLHPTEETDIETIEGQIAVDTFEELDALHMDGDIIR